MTKKTNKIRYIIDKASSNRKLYVFLFCLILATFFWLLNALSKNFVTTEDFDMIYVNTPKDKVILNDLPNNLKLKIKGLGFDLMAYKLKLKKPSLTIDLSKLKFNNTKNNKQQQITVASNFYAPYLSSQLGEQIEIREMTPDSLLFVLDDRKEKTVKIIPVTQIELRKQFQLFGKLLVKPAITKVSGPASIIDTLNEVYTENILFTDLHQTVTEPIGFDPKYKKQRLIFNPGKVILHVPIEKYTESSVVVKINYSNVPENIKIKAIPGEVELKFLIPLSKMASLPSAVFKAEIDYNQINDNFGNKLKVVVSESPSYIQLININPAKVEYILKKQN